MKEGAKHSILLIAFGSCLSQTVLIPTAKMASNNKIIEST